MLLILKSGQRWSCCRNGCELGLRCYGMTLMGGMGWSFWSHVSTIKRVETTTIICILVAFVHATSSIYSGNLLIEWPNGSCILLKQLMPYVYYIHIHYKKELVTKTNPVSQCPCDSILLKMLQLVSMHKYLICRWVKCLPWHVKTMNLHC